jgi:hypothetical protein
MQHEKMKSVLSSYIQEYQPCLVLEELSAMLVKHLRERDRIEKMFSDRQISRTSYIKQYFTIAGELRAIGVTIGGASKNREDIKQWKLEWRGDRAALYWTPSNGWEIVSVSGGELQGSWEGFDLIEHLDANGIDI